MCNDGSAENVTDVLLLSLTGDLLGYKIFYYSIPSESRNPEEIEVVSASHTTHNLIFLDMYTNYSISILAFNPAGEGPRSNPINVKTLQGIPGPPANLQFSEITMNTLKVSWEPPAKPNGEILGYIVAYETAEQDESKCYCVTHKSPLICIFCTSFKTSTMNKSKAPAPLSVILVVLSQNGTTEAKTAILGLCSRIFTIASLFLVLLTST